MALPMYGRYDLLDRRNYLQANHTPFIEDFMAAKVLPGSPAAFPDVWHAVNPIDRVRADAPPMLVTHGTGDTLLSHEDARDFTDALRLVSSKPVT